MKTKDYVIEFGLDLENFEFDRNSFLSSLNNDLLDSLPKYGIGVEGLEPSYPKFKTCIKEIEVKFWSISNKKAGKPFSPKLWSAFFAIYIIPLRAKYFPEIAARIDEKKALGL